MSRKIPQIYKEEYNLRRRKVIKGRVNLLLTLALILYFLASLISLAAYPDQFKLNEVPFWALLIISSLAIFFLNARSRTLVSSKINAYIFTALLLAIASGVSALYYEYFMLAAPIFVFSLFLVSFTIPWDSAEIAPIALMHGCAYYIVYLMVKGRTGGADQVVGDGVIFLAMSFILCYTIRGKDNDLDRENFLLLKEVEMKNAQMKRELELATRVHKTLIPKSISTDIVDVAVLYLPMYYMGGDYAKFHFIDKDRLILIICDVTGHGVSAALLVNRLHTEFERLARDGKEPGVLLKELNDFITREFSGINMFVSAFSALIDFKASVIKYSNHGHPTQYIYRVTPSDIKRLTPQAGLMGLPLSDDSIYQHEVTFKKGDRLFLFTDGIIETRDPQGTEFGQQMLESFISKNHSLEVNLFNQKLLDELQQFRHGSFEDDIFIINIHIK